MAVLDQQVIDRYAIYNGDCIEVMADLPPGSIHGSIYSPPFRGLYHYSSSERDRQAVKNLESLDGAVTEESALFELGAGPG